MANSYKAGKWSGALVADIESDGSKTTPTLDSDFDTELDNLVKIKKEIRKTLSQIETEVKALKNHSDTGRMATDYLSKTATRIRKVRDSLDASVSEMATAVNQAHKEEWNRIKKWYQEAQAAQSKNV